jgi:two-component system nitrogen regulation sensor histidine kinase NtrY
MVFSRFIWTTLILVLAILFTSVGLGFFLQKPAYPVTISLMIVLLVMETFFLIYHLFRIRRDLIRMTEALRNEDASVQFSKNSGDPYFSRIHEGFNDIIRNFRLIRLDREAEHHFFRATVDHIQFGMIAFDQDGRVEMVNRSFLELFQLDRIEGIGELGSVTEDLPRFLKHLPGTGEALKRIRMDGHQHHLIFLASGFRLMQQEITLVSVRDISREIDRNELEAWQKLMRVMRHEILNSITPIKILAGNLANVIQPGEGIPPLGNLSESELADLREGLGTIHRRATGLSGFLDAFSNLYRSPEPRLEKVQVPAMLRRIHALFREQFIQDGVTCRVECAEPGLAMDMDEKMVEHVLINLVKNALQAMQTGQEKILVLSGNRAGSDLVIGVRDNGTGIPADRLDSIFIPFYSTREGGSGIGLSFSQHVMRLHGGYLDVHSEPGKGSTFRLVFMSAAL